MENQKTNRRKIKVGNVISNKMNKTVVVNVNRTLRHNKYGKVVTRGKKYYAHNEGQALNIGDEVTIQETRPISKLKRWKVVNNVSS